MIDILIKLGIGVLIGYLAYCDLRKKNTYSIITSGVLLSLLIFYIQNIHFAIILAFFGYLLIDEGILSKEFLFSDIKVLAIIGLMLSSINQLLFFIILAFPLLISWKLISKKWFTDKNPDLIIFWIAYILSLFLPFLH